ncbi:MULTISPECIES: sulfate ABC transporter permease subunit CysT [Methylosinus]|uniref:Sulfate transport system permease protein CysT n=1 Tax=Methylosinus trichosporium (strain ATCC 35070 / NCIMB 11131 / UNIQEM 75 / OB3b) TaxID=595536 RepID=A0A2D2D3U9_METT3|nr:MULTISPECIES: sulfate ABC transporter permease subunit CysT [Methylosinus]ATQ69645.1 sulfate ABC transporter permease subunit CysT [Methylosinus trichosporium OB3b]OBS53017.1 sulfate ABC transporter permease subunit CysT [Methylosinus sp. 3S-1]
MSAFAASRGKAWRFAAPSVIPGFRATFGFTIFYLSLVVLFPLSLLILRASELGLAGLYGVATEPRVAAALRTSFFISFAAAAIDVVFGLVAAWVLSRYEFFGRRFLDAIVDLPFALPTAVAGISLAALYAPNGWIGEPLAAYDIKIAFTRWGILVALVFVGLPFVVRTVQPLIAEIDAELEEASATLGASRAQTVWRVLLPPMAPALLTGFALAFARSVGEYGSVIFIAGNIAYVSEIAPLLIVVKLEQFDYTGATGVATIMLAISFSVLLAINLIQAWSQKRFGHV